MITTDKEFAKAVLRIWEIGDLLPRLATKVEGILFDTPSKPLEFEDYKMLMSLGKELCELSASIPFPGQRLICENGMINTEAENANRDDVVALEIDSMSESQIDKAIQDEGVDPEALVERIEKRIRKQVN